MNIPYFWKTKLSDIQEAYNSASKATEKRILTTSAGGRPVYMLAYGAKKAPGKANYSSALGAGDASAFKNPTNNHPTVVLLGAVHGQETEGTAALMNLISLIETGLDLDGKANNDLIDALSKVRLVIVPIVNPDGRDRVVPESMIGLTGKELRYWGQGTWKDKTLCGWPDCKKLHPILGHTDFLGGYYNDNGINIMHDNFFRPMASETSAILELCEKEEADFVLHLHGGSNSKGDLLQPHYVTDDANRAIYELSERCFEKGKNENLEFCIMPMPDTPKGKNPPSFNLVCACHHVCGAVSVCYESNECIIDEPGPKLTHEEIIRMHMILFEECALMAKAGCAFCSDKNKI